jgi:hypothetical protein
MCGLNTGYNAHFADPFYIRKAKDLCMFDPEPGEVEWACRMSRAIQVTQDLFVRVDDQRIGAISNRMRVHLETGLDPALNQWKKDLLRSPQNAPR